MSPMAVSGAILMAIVVGSVSSTRLGETDLVVPAVAGAVLNLAPEFSGAINDVRWYKGTTFVAGYFSGYTMLSDEVEHRADLDPTSGSLRISDWKLSDDGEYSVQINGQALPQKYTVQSTTHATEGGTLYLDPERSKEIKTMTWSWNGSNLIEWSESSGETIHAGQKHPGMILDTTTGQLTIPNWNQNMDGLYRVSINENSEHRKFSVVTAVYAQIGQLFQLDPKITTEYPTIHSIVWVQGAGNMVARCFPESGRSTIFDPFQASINQMTAALTVAPWKKTHDGVFSLQINGQKNVRKYTVNTVNNLDSYPDVRLRYHRGGAAKGALVCGGMYEGAGPVTYEWRKGTDGQWTRGGKIIDVTSGGYTVTREDYPYDACKVLNPLGQKEGTLDA